MPPNGTRHIQNSHLLITSNLSASLVMLAFRSKHETRNWRLKIRRRLRVGISRRVEIRFVSFEFRPLDDSSIQSLNHLMIPVVHHSLFIIHRFPLLVYSKLHTFENIILGAKLRVCRLLPLGGTYSRNVTNFCKVFTAMQGRRCLFI